MKPKTKTKWDKKLRELKAVICKNNKNANYKQELQTKELHVSSASWYHKLF